jgi:RimJ/RimL family protein N-acetyltransferase
MVGLNILAPYQGKGYGSEAIKWSLRWGFLHGNLHKIELGYFGWNTEAGRLYRKLGFVDEGRKRDHFWHDGAYYDEVMLVS